MLLNIIQKYNFNGSVLFPLNNMLTYLIVPLLLDI